MMRLIFTIFFAVIVAGCQNLKGPEPIYSKNYIELGNSINQSPNVLSDKNVESLSDRFLRSASKAGMTSAGPDDFRQFSEDGMLLLEARCQVYFHSLGQGAQNLDFAIRQIELITGGLSTGLALANVSKEAIPTTTRTDEVIAPSSPSQQQGPSQGGSFTIEIK